MPAPPCSSTSVSARRFTCRSKHRPCPPAPAACDAAARRTPPCCRPSASNALVGQALLNPVAVEADFVQQSRAGAAQVTHLERLQRQTGCLGPLHDELCHPVQRRVRHTTRRLIAQGPHELRARRARVQRHQDVKEAWRAMRRRSSCRTTIRARIPRCRLPGCKRVVVSPHPERRGGIFAVSLMSETDA